MSKHVRNKPQKFRTCRKCNSQSVNYEGKNFRGSFYCRRGKNTAMLPQASCKECWARFFVYFPLSGAARRAEIATNAFYRILLRSLSVFRSNFMGHPNRIERHNDPFELNYEQAEKTFGNSQKSNVFSA